MPDYLTYPTNTLTLRAERLLQGKGIAVTVRSRPPGLHGPCALALQLPEDTLQRAIALLAAAKLPPPKEHRLPQ